MDGGGFQGGGRAKVRGRPSTRLVPSLHVAAEDMYVDKKPTWEALAAFDHVGSLARGTLGKAAVPLEKVVHV